MNSKKIFKNLCVVIIFSVLYFLVYGIFVSGWDAMQFRDVGKKLGVIASFFFCLTIAPGIIRRSNVNFLGEIPSHLLFARAQLGLTMFFTALGHYLFVAIIPFVRFGIEPNIRAYYIFGMLALFLSSWLAITSNQFSKKLLKQKWKTLHSLVYIIVWLIFLHTALIQINPISVLLGIFAVAETLSLIYDRSKKNP
jgi:DMSO/TMAO reductase YedYZ heme-binding membrane subunit